MNTLHSGGASGADAVFGTHAKLAGHEVKHYSFLNHKHDPSCPPESIVILNDWQLSEGEPFLKEASKVLGRKYPTQSNHTNNLLRRNYHQIRNVQSVYVIGYLDDDGVVTGGTGWAVTMAAQTFVRDIYLYDQGKRQWYKFDSQTPKKLFWSLMMDLPPYPRGEYAGIGSRNMTLHGHDEIINLYRI